MDCKKLIDETIEGQHPRLANIEPSRKKLSISRFVYDSFLSQLQSMANNSGLKAVTIYKGMDIVVFETEEPNVVYISIQLK